MAGNHFQEIEQRRDAFFIDYSNNSLRDNPEYLRSIDDTIGHEIFSEITKTILLLLTNGKTERVDPEQIKDIPEDMEQFVLLMERRPSTSYYQSIEETEGYESTVDTLLGLESKEFRNTGIITASSIEYFREIYLTAGDAIYGGIDCNSHCGRELSKMRLSLFDEELFLEYQGDEKAFYEKGQLLFDGKLKCYECDQLHFKTIIDLIIDGQDYSSIPGFNTFFWDAYELIKITLYPKIETTDRNESILTRKHTFQLELGYDDIIPQIEPGRISVYRRAILALAMHSLVEFLSNNDRRLLKKCDQCSNYYIAKRKGDKQRFCSDRCRLALHNKNRIESGEAAKYKRDKRQNGARESYY